MEINIIWIPLYKVYTGIYRRIDQVEQKICITESFLCRDNKDVCIKYAWIQRLLRYMYVAHAPFS